MPIVVQPDLHLQVRVGPIDTCDKASYLIRECLKITPCRDRRDVFEEPHHWPIIPIPKQDWSTSPHSTIRKILMSTSSARRSRCASEMMLIYLTKVVFLQDDCVCVVNLRPHFLFIPHHPITSYDSYLRYRPHIVCILNYNLYYCFNDSYISNSLARSAMKLESRIPFTSTYRTSRSRHIFYDLCFGSPAHK